MDWFDWSAIQPSLSIIIRLVLSAFLGACIGVDRVRKRRPAGIKTHALVCLGAALVMVTGEYIWVQFGQSSDITRLSAQVISGVGFLGAGTIIVTGRNQIKGLTTAAGLWFSACLGLAIGCGFYLGAFTAVLMMFLVVKVFARVDLYLHNRSMIMDLYIEYEANVSIGKILAQMKKIGCSVLELQNGQGSTGSGSSHSYLLLSIHLSDKTTHANVLDAIQELEGILYLEEV